MILLCNTESDMDLIREQIFRLESAGNTTQVFGRTVLVYPNEPDLL